MRAVHVLLLLAAAGGGALLAHAFKARGVPDADPAPIVEPELNPAPAPAAETPDEPARPGIPAPLPEPSFVAGESYYLQVLRPAGLDIEVMTPSVVTPFAGDTLSEGVPDT